MQSLRRHFYVSKKVKLNLLTLTIKRQKKIGKLGIHVYARILILPDKTLSFQKLIRFDIHKGK